MALAKKFFLSPARSRRRSADCITRLH